jgi:hypothetical protein
MEMRGISKKKNRIGFIKRVLFLLFGAGIFLTGSGCVPTLHVFYYKIPDSPQVRADIRDCQRTSLMSDVNQWTVMGSCLNTIPDVSWYYGSLREQSCYNARSDGDIVGWVLYDCYVPEGDLGKIKGAYEDGNKPGIYLYQNMVDTMKARSEQQPLKTKSK